MSLGVVIKAPEGLVLATDSRLTLTAQSPETPPLHVNFDNVSKLLSFGEPNTYVGVVTYGLAVIGLRTPQSFVPEFEAQLAQGPQPRRLTVSEFAVKFSEFFVGQWKQFEATLPAPYTGPNMTFVVAGYDDDEPYGKMFLIEIPAKSSPTAQHDGVGMFGIAWGGQREIVDRLLQGFDERLGTAIARLGLPSDQTDALAKVRQQIQMPIPLQALPLQDCVDLAIFFIRTTIIAQKLTVGIRGVGGPIDVATITRHEGLRFVQRKRIVGEVGEVGYRPERTRE
jgi:hypothetical protein